MKSAYIMYHNIFYIKLMVLKLYVYHSTFTVPLVTITREIVVLHLIIGWK